MLGPLVKKGLNVRLGEHAASGGDGIQPLALKAQFVQLVGGNPQQGGHLVDKGPCASGAGTIHPLVDTAIEKNDLGVLTAQLYHGGGVRLQAADHLPGGEHLLDKGYTSALRQSQPRRAGDSGGKAPPVGYAHGL